MLLFSPTTQLETLIHGPESGEHQMAWDTATLEAVRATPDTHRFIARTFLWQAPTWSLGVHQPTRDVEHLQQRAGNPPVVTRPTGGRAILHGDDVSFSIITNDPLWLSVNIRESYCWVSGWLKSALQACGVPLRADCATDENPRNTRDYVRSAECFETAMPSDILDAKGRKILGSAQLRRAGGLLLQGSAFLKPYGISSDQFTEAWFSEILQTYSPTSAC